MKEFKFWIYHAGKWECINTIRESSPRYSQKKIDDMFVYYRNVYGALNVKVTERCLYGTKKVCKV